MKDPHCGDGFRMGRESRDKEIEALQAELASERSAHEETKRELASKVAVIENWKPLMLAALRYACHVDALAGVADELPAEYDPRSP